MYVTEQWFSKLNVNQNGDTDIENRLVDTVGEGERATN